MRAKVDIPAQYSLTTVLWEPYFNATCRQLEQSFMRESTYQYAREKPNSDSSSNEVLWELVAGSEGEYGIKLKDSFSPVSS